MVLTLKTISSQQLSKGTEQWKPGSLKDFEDNRHFVVYVLSCLN